MNILTVPELKELTGTRQRARMIEVLVRNSVPFVVAADGWPRVHREALLGGQVRLPSREESEPDIHAIAS